MAASPHTGQPRVEKLLKAVEELSPAERREFQRQLLSVPMTNGAGTATESDLLTEARARMPITRHRRLRRLIAKSERGTLTAKELAEYQALAHEARALDVVRLQALAELAHRWNRSIKDVMKAIGTEDAGNAP
jgi:hypothetical protein